METPTRFTVLLGESLFAGAFAVDPDQAVEPLITRCLEAAISWDSRVDALTKAGLVPAVTETKRNNPSDNSQRQKRGKRK